MSRPYLNFVPGMPVTCMVLLSVKEVFRDVKILPWENGHQAWVRVTKHYKHLNQLSNINTSSQCTQIHTTYIISFNNRLPLHQAKVLPENSLEFCMQSTWMLLHEVLFMLVTLPLQGDFRPTLPEWHGKTLNDDEYSESMWIIKNDMKPSEIYHCSFTTESAETLES